MAEGNRRLIVVRQAFLELEIRYVDLELANQHAEYASWMP